jgi:hypothetical protein
MDTLCLERKSNIYMEQWKNDSHHKIYWYYPCCMSCPCTSRKYLGHILQSNPNRIQSELQCMKMNLLYKLVTCLELIVFADNDMTHTKGFCF